MITRYKQRLLKGILTISLRLAHVKSHVQYHLSQPPSSQTSHRFAYRSPLAFGYDMLSYTLVDQHSKKFPSFNGISENHQRFNDITIPNFLHDVCLMTCRWNSFGLFLYKRNRFVFQQYLPKKHNFRTLDLKTQVCFEERSL